MCSGWNVVEVRLVVSCVVVVVSIFERPDNVGVRASAVVVVASFGVVGVGWWLGGLRGTYLLQGELPSWWCFGDIYSGDAGFVAGGLNFF